jgi:hypothetical protein
MVVPGKSAPTDRSKKRSSGCVAWLRSSTARRAVAGAANAGPLRPVKAPVRARPESADRRFREGGVMKTLVFKAVRADGLIRTIKPSAVKGKL